MLQHHYLIAFITALAGQASYINIYWAHVRLVSTCGRTPLFACHAVLQI